LYAPPANTAALTSPRPPLQAGLEPVECVAGGIGRGFPVQDCSEKD